MQVVIRNMECRICDEEFGEGHGFICQGCGALHYCSEEHMLFDLMMRHNGEECRRLKSQMSALEVHAQPGRSHDLNSLAQASQEA